MERYIKNEDKKTKFKIILPKETMTPTLENENDHLDLEISVPYLYVTFTWNFECRLLSSSSPFSSSFTKTSSSMIKTEIKKENEPTNLVQPSEQPLFSSSTVFYEHITLPLSLMIAEQSKRLEKYEDIIKEKEKDIQMLYDQLILAEESPPKRFKLEKFNKNVFDEELRYSTDIISSSKSVFTKESLIKLYKGVTNMKLSKTLPELVKDEYKTVLLKERQTQIPTLPVPNIIKPSLKHWENEVSHTGSSSVMNSLKMEDTSSASMMTNDNIYSEDYDQSVIDDFDKSQEQEESKETELKEKRKKIEKLQQEKLNKKKNKRRKFI